MRRREFITLLSGAEAGPIAGCDHELNSKANGALMNRAAGDQQTTARVAAFGQGLEKRAWSDDRNIHFDYRFRASTAERIPAFAKELVALQPDVILAQSTVAAAVLQQETRTIPIVFVNVSDPVGAGFIRNMARPG